jgi:hypothetical protein
MFCQSSFYCSVNELTCGKSFFAHRSFFAAHNALSIFWTVVELYHCPKKPFNLGDLFGIAKMSVTLNPNFLQHVEWIET